MYRIVLFFITVLLATSCSAAPDYAVFAGPLQEKPVNNNSYVDKAVKNFPRSADTDKKNFHLISHGRPGELLLNGQWRNPQQVAEFLQQYATNPFTHLYIYGCEFGKGEKGKAAVAYLEKVVGVAVSASDDITGKDGDWVLETGTPVTAESYKDYDGNLQYGPTDDFDNDGIQNRFDIDDDNDGIPDAIESPSCFYTADEWNTMAKPAGIVTITSALTTTTANFSQLLDGINNVTAVTFSNSPAQPIQNVNVYLFTFSGPVRLDALYLKFNTTTQFAGATKIQGSNTNNGTDWADLSAGISTVTTNTTVNGSVSVTTSIKYPVTINTTTAYKYIRITGAVASNIAAQNASEVYFDFNTAAYVASSYPKASCTDANIDGDNILPQFDLDSDGDGCSDAFEAGATTNTTANFQFTGTDANLNGLVDSKENGTTGFINYTSTYNQYAITSALKSCVDTDGDGIFDVMDLDDDNDGIPDKIECPSLTTNLAGSGGFSVAASALTNWYVGFASSSLPTAEPFTASVITISNNGNVDNYGIGGGNQVNSPLTGGLFDWYDGVNTATGLQYVLQEQDPNRPVVVQLAAPLVAGATYSYAFDLGNRGTGSATTKYIVMLYNNDTKMPEKIIESGILNTLPAYNATPSYKNFAGSFIPAASGNYSLLFYPSISGGGNDDFVIDRVAVAGSTVNACDTDGDGIPNHLDLDSDGDGCPDLKEAGVRPLTDISTPASTTNNAGGSYGILASSLSGSQLNPDATDANNDGINDSVDPDLNGQTNYLSTYSQYALNATLNMCHDLDGDGIDDIVDIDDDNDGIVDAVESPACFYTEAEATAITSVTSELTQYSTYVITNSYDGNTSTESAFNPSQNWVGKSIFEITPAIPLAISSVNFDIGTWKVSNGATSTFRLEGWDGANWIVLSADTLNNTLNDFSVRNTLHPATVYSKYRIAGVAGTSYYSGVDEITLTAYQYVASAHPKPSCSNDTDGDGVLNHQDLDSDGDGCPDLREASVSPLTDVSTPSSATNNNGTSYGISIANIGNSQLNPAGTDANNDGLNDSVDPDLNGQTNYTSTYNNYAINNNLNACLDSDGDGINDVLDIDDDNDGITDIIEQMITCSTRRPDNATSTATNFGSGRELANTYDGDLTTYGGTDAGAAPQIISNVTYLFNTPMYKVNQVLFYPNGGTVYNDGQVMSIDTIKFLDNSNNLLYYKANVSIAQATTGSSFTTIDVSSENKTGVAKIVFINLKDDAHGSSSTAIWREIEVNYCTQEADTDGDGIPNRLDLDSDGDGCPDLKEASVSPLTDVSTPSSAINNNGTSYGISIADIGNSQLNPAGVDTNNDGLNDSVDPDLNGQTNYTSTYNLYALVKNWNFCNDKDGDGILDLDDIDDDNDGILDAVESPACFYTSAEMAIPSAVSTEIPTAGTITNVYDNNTATTFAFTSTTAANALGKTVFEITPVLPQAANSIILNSASSPFGTISASATLRAEGWNGANWVALATYTSSPGISSGTMTFAFSNTTRYFKYRLYESGTSGIAINTNAIQEIKLGIPAGYIPSANPKPSCAVDTDGNGIPNHQDLDSDGDGCSDAVETGVTGTLLPAFIVNNAGVFYSPQAIAQGPYGINGFANPLETSTSPESGIYTGSYANYSNATNSAIHNCAQSPQAKPDVNVTYVNTQVSGNLATNDIVEAGSTYGSVATVPGYTNPGSEMPLVNSDGTYTFIAATTGVYQFYVSVCPPSMSTGCQQVLLTIEVLNSYVQTNKPVANPDLATTKMNVAVTLKTLTNDHSGNNFTNLQPSSVAITAAPKKGVASVNTTTGDITYTPATGFIGQDTLTYSVCDDASPSPNCNTSYQIITVLPSSAFNSITASDDYLFVPQGTTGSGNVLSNDYDPDGNTMTVAAQNMTIAGKGTFILQTNGSYTFEAESSFTGAINFPYHVCDNGAPVACTYATVYILVPAVGSLPLDLLTFTAVKENGNIVGLNWTTTNEINSSHFIIERMMNGSGQWEAIGTVHATGNGNTSVNSYYFQDRFPLYGANYYRLKQVDLDGSFKYSPVRLVSFGGTGTLTVYPNPADDHVIIKSSGLLPASIHIYDALGQQLDGMIRVEQLSPQQLKIQLYRLTPGMYIIKVNNHVIKVIKK